MPLRYTYADGRLKLQDRLHRTVVKASHGRLGSFLFGMPVVQLQVTGRRSGLPRTTMLMSPIMDDRKVVLVASKRGDDRDPDWYRNLVVNPDVETTVIKTGERRLLRARVASDEEKTEMWPQIVATFKGYARYQKRTRRQIPVVVCEPRSP
jgi:deazaflavin-dependent oxidoreductase (nitroreductase family)